MTAPDLRTLAERLRELATKTTPGPWTWERHDEDDDDGSISYEVWNLTKEHYTRIFTINDGLDNTNAKANAAFIAEANPTSILALLDRISALERELAAAREAQRTLFDAIKHGDEKHQAWLLDAINRHFAILSSSAPPARWEPKFRWTDPNRGMSYMYLGSVLFGTISEIIGGPRWSGFNQNGVRIRTFDTADEARAAVERAARVALGMLEEG